METTQTKQLLRELLAKHLLIPIEEIDDDQLLVSLGADSLTMSTILSYLSDTYGVKLKMVQLFEELPTISAIANYLDQVATIKN